MNDIPVGSLKPNSNKFKEHLAKEKEKEKEKEKPKPVVKSAARIREKSLGDKFSGFFDLEDGKEVKNYLVKDLLIPAIKDIVVSLVSDGLGMYLKTNRRPSSNGGKTNYAQISTNYHYGSNSNRRNDADDNNSRADYRNITYASREDANEVLSSLQDLADRYDQASISDLFDLAGVTLNGRAFTDNNYGWTFDMLKRVPIKRAYGGGFMLDLPDPKVLD